MAQPGGMASAPSPEAIDRDVRTLKEALRVVLGGYGGTPSGDPKERLRATEWLHSFQRRDDAWQACVAVLGAERGVGDNQVGLDEQIFASQALLYKCRRRRAPITGDDVACLLRLALGFTGGGLRAVRIQLCLGICACAVRHSSWEPSKVVPDMVMYCQKASEDAGHNDPGPRVLMLELLTVLPDEATARAGISAPPDRRKNFLWTLRSGGGGEAGRMSLGVLSELIKAGALPEEGALGAVLRCALAWMQLEAVSRADMLASPIMTSALEALEAPEACDDACELVTLSLEAFSEEPGAAEEMLPRVLSRAHALSTAPSEDVCRCLAMVFAEAACAYLPGILKPELAGHWGSLLQIMVGMLEHPNLEIAGLALEFWGMLGELLAEMACAEGGRGPRSPPLEESVRHACGVAMLRARYPPGSPSLDGAGSFEEMDGDDRDELEDFREKVQELLQTLILPPPPPEQEPHPQHRKGRAAGSPSPPRRRLSGTGERSGPVSALGGRGGGGTGASGGRGVMTPGYDGGADSHRSRHSSATVVTPDSSSRSGGGYTDAGGRRASGGGVEEARPGGGVAWAGAAAAEEAARAAQAKAEKAEGVMRLSPVQAGLLEWLEGLAASSTREALEKDHARRQQQQGDEEQRRRRLSAGGSSGAGVPGGGPGEETREAAGTPGVVDGLPPGGDWAGVEVVLRMLSAATKALNIRDCSPPPEAAAGTVTGVDATAAAAAAATAAYRGHVAVVPVDCGGVAGRGTGATEALVNMLPALPPSRRELQRSAAVLVGGLAAWLARRPRSLEPALQSVLGVLGLEEGGGRDGRVSMRDKGEDHVGAVALAKLVSAAGPSLAAVPELPTHLLRRYLELSAQLQRHRLLRPGTGSAAAAPSSREWGTAAGPTPNDNLGGRTSAYPWQNTGSEHHVLGVEEQQQQQQHQEEEHRRRLSSGGRDGPGSAAGAGSNGVAPPPPPPLHAGSLRLFLGCLCRMLGEAPMLPPETGAVLDHRRQRKGAGPASATGEVEEVLRALVEGELRCLGGVLDRRREIAAAAGTGPVPPFVEEESRALADVARDSLSKLSLILGKTGPALDAPGLVAHCCGLGEGSAAAAAVGDGSGGGGGGGVLGAMVEAFSGGEEKMLPHLCRLFEALVWSTSQRIRYFNGESVARPGVNGVTTDGGHHPQHPPYAPRANSVQPDTVMEGGGGVSLDGLMWTENIIGGGAAKAAAAGGLRVSAVFGDVLAEAFRRRPFHRYLDALRSITKELPVLGSVRSSTTSSPEVSSDTALAVSVPDLTLRASEWVDQCLWAAATEVGGRGRASSGGMDGNGATAAAGNGIGFGAVIVERGGAGGGAAAAAGAAGVGVVPLAGPDAHPELVEALFKLMAEWIKELPMPSLRWLEAWLSVAVSGLAVRHRGPARAVLGLIQACCSQRKIPQFTEAFSALLRGTALGVSLSRGLLSGMCGAMPSWMLDDLVLTVRSLFDSLSPALASTLVEAVLQDPTFERFAVSNELKIAFSRKLKEDFCNKDWRAFKAGLKAFCGGKKKGTGGTPPVHAAAAAAAAARRQQTPPQYPTYLQNHLPNQQQQPQFANNGGAVPGAAGGRFGSSGGVVNVPGAVGGQDGAAAGYSASPPSQPVPRSMTM